MVRRFLMPYLSTMSAVLMFSCLSALAVEPAADGKTPADESGFCDGCFPEPSKEPEPSWATDYVEASRMAREQGRMLFVYFCDPGENSPCNRFKAETLDSASVRERLWEYVCLRLPMDAKITVGGEQVSVLGHAAFAEMLGRPGIAIVDYTNSEAEYYGYAVSTFPITDQLWYTPEQMATILDLPPGTLTQRTLIYAVRTHPDRPASTDGQVDENLTKEASSHSRHQADIKVQGHHNWGSRFHRINAKLPPGLTATEVCAESWPGENLVEAAIECVRCWRFSSGHWSAVRASHPVYGYDMKRGRNGVWYATGIFGQG